MTEESKPGKYGILYIHGAGMPEDQTALIGDPLATIADGLLDHFQQDLFLRDRYRILAKTYNVKNRGTEELELNIYAKGKSQPEYIIRIREVLWKPLAPKLSISTYLPLVWQWVFAFQSNLERAEALVEYISQKRKLPVSSAQMSPAASERLNSDLGAIYDKRSQVRHNWQMLSRIALAVSGLFFTLLAWVAAEIYRRQNVIYLRIEWLTADQVAAALFATSLVAAVLLTLLAIQERQDNEAPKPESERELEPKSKSKSESKSKPETKPKPHSPLQLLLIALTTAWLSIFVLPILLGVYYLDRIVSWGIELCLAGAILLVALKDLDWVTRIVLLFGITLVIWVITRLSIWGKLTRNFKLRRRNIQNRAINLITTLIVTGAAPWAILLISTLEWLSFLPLFGDDLKKLAQSISEAGFWQALKDIYLILTDSSRSAVVRYSVEQAIRKIDKLGDLDAIHIFAHSLGTVVAYDTLVQIGQGNGIFVMKESENKRDGQAKTGNPGELYSKIETLVTFGSPLNKIRTLAHFEGGEVMSGFDYSRFGLGARLPQDLGNGTFRWINVYSPHDIVSDACVAYSEPGDLVHPRDFTAWSANDLATAHGIYWLDKGFWNIALESMGIVYPRGSEKPVHIEQIPLSDMRDGVIKLLEGEASQTQLTKEERAKVLHALDKPTAVQRVVARLREIGIATETQFTTQVTQTHQPIGMLKELGLITKA